MKFNSDRLKKFNYDIELTINEAIRNKELISVFENQLIDSILDINNRQIDYEKIENLKKEINFLKKQQSSEENGKLITQYQDEINEEIFITEYKTIRMDSKKHYENLNQNG